MQPLRNVLVENQACTAGATATTDLPVNPLYCVYYTIKALAAGAPGTTDNAVGLKELLSYVTNLQILFRGSIVVNAALEELYVMAGILMENLPFVGNFRTDALAASSLTVPIYLGRSRMMGDECFPATRKGELVINRKFNTTFTNADPTTVTEQIETFELLDATPKAFLKYGALTKLMNQLQDNDFDLPMGNPQIGTLLHGTTPWSGDPSAATLARVKLLIDNVEFFYAQGNWETLHGDLIRRLDLNGDPQSYTVTENLAAAYAQDAETGRPNTFLSVLEPYAYMDYDPFDNDATLVQTANRGRVNLRVFAGTADTARVIPLELISVGAPAA